MKMLSCINYFLSFCELYYTFTYDDTGKFYFDLTLISELNHVGAVLGLDVQILSRQMITQQGKGSISIYPS